MFIPEPIFKMLQNRSQLQLNLVSHCDALVMDVEQVTGKHIGVNTFKRLLGFYDDGTVPRVSTLDILANYLGISTWSELVQYLEVETSEFNVVEGELKSADLKNGCIVELTYMPDRKLLLEYLGDSRFHVLMALNSKLQEDDVLHISHIIPTFPLIVTEVERQGHSLGRYTAAKQSGIQTIKRLF